MKTFTTIPLLIAAALVLSGCADPNKPSDLPKLYPCKITVTQEGKPLEGATVTLTAKDTAAQKYGACSAMTNASGVAVLRTYGFDGVPVRQYRVAVSKIGVEEQIEKIVDGEKVLTGGKIYSYVEAKYSDAAEPPFSISVTEKGAAETFDAGKPVHLFLRKNEE